VRNDEVRFMRRLILFDIDGTLLSAQGAPRRAFTRALVDVFGTAGPIEGHAFDGKTDPQIARELLVLAGLSNAAIDAGLPELWRVYVRELDHELSVPGHETKVYPGVRELLSELERRSREQLLGLLTGNIQDGAARKLASARIESDFRIGAFGSDCERRDGLPEVAVARARELTGRHFRDRDVVIIGDTPADVSCGASIGVRTVAVATGRYTAAELEDAGAQYVFADLSQTGAVLDALLGD
jgi:phosphoglycolate phosphatase-like HAD superfamily hydrolase